MAGIISDTYKLGGVPQSSSRNVAMSTCFDIYFGDQIQVGFISSLTLGHSRTVTQIRHLNSADAGIAVDTVMTPDAITLQYNGFYIYNNLTGPNTQGSDSISGVASGDPLTSSVVGVGASGGRMAGIQLLMTLDQQNIPFDIVVRHQGLNSKVVGVYKNCTLASMNVPIQLSNAAVSDSGSISVGYVSSSLTA